jgi:hypothetical protein
MKKILFSLFAAALVLVSLESNAQKIEFDNDFVDYGEIDNGANGERSLKFRNVGKEPLLITNAKGSCGCTVPEYPKEPIMPGKEAVLKIKYDTKRTGPINKTVTVTTNEPEGENTHKINVKGTVKAPAPSTDGVPLRQNSGAPVGM